jgi:hypothetical protein
MVGSEKYPWVILDGDAPLCTHCGARDEALFPVKISEKRMKALQLLFGAFADEHADCKETETSPSKKKWTRPEEWLRGHDTGTSSLTIYTVMTGQMVDRTGYPLDPDDLGRCYRLLKLFPAWRPRMPEVAAKFKEWGPLVREWDKLIALYEEELPSGFAPKCYAAMKACLKEAGVR